jgi:hypothetical protein
MGRLAGWTRLRLAAVAMLLLLRPCVVFFSAEFLSSQSSNEARIAFIDDDIAIARLAVARRAPLPANHQVAVSCPIVPASIAIVAPSQDFFDDSAPVSFHHAAVLVRAFAGRAPPL